MLAASPGEREHRGLQQFPKCLTSDISKSLPVPGEIRKTRLLWQVFPHKARVLTFILKSWTFLVYKSPLFHEKMVVFYLMCLLCKVESWQPYPSPNKKKEKKIYSPEKFTSLGITGYTCNIEPTQGPDTQEFFETHPICKQKP